jgi:hypothetical protein
MLFSPSAYFGGTAAPMAWNLAVTEHGPLFLQLVEAQEPAHAAYADPSEWVAREQRMAQAATDEFPGWPKGIATDGDDGRVQSVMEQPGANLQPRLTGPLLPRARRHRRVQAGLALRCAPPARLRRCTRRPRLSG